MTATISGGVILRVKALPLNQKVTGYRFYEHLTTGAYKLLGISKLPEWKFTTAGETVGKLYCWTAINAGGEGKKSGDVPGLPGVATSEGWVIILKVTK